MSGRLLLNNERLNVFRGDIGSSLTSSSYLKALLTRHDYIVSSKLGQNFLCDAHAVAAIIAAAQPEGRDVLEIGPGCGTLTRALAASARRVRSIEVARRLAPVLAETLADLSNVELRFGDFLHVPAEDFAGVDWLMVSNLPYSITTPALFRFLDGEIPWRRMVITVQAEVAVRMAAAPGSSDYGALSVSAQAAARIEIIKKLPSSLFWPRPRVASAVVRLEPARLEQASLGQANLEPRLLSKPMALRPLLRSAFSARRKILTNALADHPIALQTLLDRGLAPSARPETVAVEDWIMAAAAEDVAAGAGARDVFDNK